MTSASIEQIQHVGDQSQNSIERFHSSLGGSGKIDDETSVAGPGKGAGEDGFGGGFEAGGSHYLAETGNFALDDIAGGFGGDVARSDASAAGGEDGDFRFGGLTR